MEFKPAKCPSCGGDLQLPTGVEQVKCMYCGGDVIVKRAIAAASGFNPESVRDLAITAYEAENYEECMEHLNRILSLNSNNAEAWLYKGLCLFRLAGKPLAGVVGELAEKVEKRGGEK